MWVIDYNRRAGKAYQWDFFREPRTPERDRELERYDHWHPIPQPNFGELSNAPAQGRIDWQQRFEQGSQSQHAPRLQNRGRCCWWVYPSDTLQWPPIFDFLSFSIHSRSSDIYCASATFSDHRANLCVIATDYTLYPSHHRLGTTSETSHMTYGPHRYISLS